MQKVLLSFGFALLTASLFAQCDELFISEYVEGYANNKALEIYNPTTEAIDLSAYSLCRFSNGATTVEPEPASEATIVTLPQVMLDPNDVFVVVLDMQDTSLWDSQFDKPVWNGYNLIDTLYDEVTGEPITDSLGNVIIGPQYSEDGAALFGNDEYNEEYDLQCKADAFLCPTYEVNKTMYFNGNDAMALILGGEVLEDGSNIIDVIGVIGENPETSIDEDAWVNAEGYWLTKDRTLVRNPDVTSGRNNLNDVIYSLGGTFTGEEWFSTYKNNFEYLGVHNSTCNTDPLPNKFSCVTGLVGTDEVNQIAFSMYPNPNSGGVLNVEAEEVIERVEIYNLLGQFMYGEEVGYTNKTTELNISNLDNGMYLVSLTFKGNHVSIQKLVVE